MPLNLSRLAVLVVLVVVGGACGQKALPRSAVPNAPSQPMETSEAESLQGADDPVLTSVAKTEVEAPNRRRETAKKTPKKALKKKARARRKATVGPSAAPAKPRPEADEARASDTEKSAPKQETTQPATTYTGEDPCRRANDSQSPVGDACRKGGVREAKREMKRMLRQARKAGIRHDCDSCHDDTDDYAHLTEGASKKFNEMLAALAKG